MDESTLRAMRLGYLCENADAIRRRLPEDDGVDLYRRLNDESDVDTALGEIAALADLAGLPIWRGSSSRDAMADVAGLPQSEVEIRLVCPRDDARRCARILNWQPEHENSPPWCKLVRAELRWDGVERFAD
ncbi:hypothetical protein FB566_1866 [Stackebrandtia endophytica]|uniref:Uncharacterized protein n=1 Tax=Stackebrandtia endophytica TaxID=1496996 RepID=A0A543AUU4_9ACTN|nr:hypothetical protein [Stackebrandtia endophytica]TQL76339.1 hypothetical protein FB566_1866 [Stackebrandtia endophytica]